MSGEQIMNQNYAEELAGKRIICLDTETTGLKIGYDQILTLAIMDVETKEVIYNKKFNPSRHEEWPDAEAVNHISPESVKNCPHIIDCKDEIMDILNSAGVIVGYNIISFDIPLLRAELGIDKIKTEIYDVMNEFTKNFTLHESIKWSQVEVAKEFNINTEGAHDALADVKICTAIYDKMMKEMKKPRLDSIYKVGDKEIYSYTLAKKYAKKIGVEVGKPTYIAENKIINVEKTVDTKYWTNHELINERKEGKY